MVDTPAVVNMKPFDRLKKILITTGDSDGIGLQVACLALEKIGPKAGSNFYIFRDKKNASRFLKKLDRSFQRITVASLKEALQSVPKNSKTIFDIASADLPPFWVEQAAKACLHQQATALVTGPLSKTLIQQAGLTDIGHTDILKRLSGASNLQMAFIGSQFSSILATGHVPLAKASAALTSEVLELTCRNALNLRMLLTPKKQRLPIAVLGLNPHAGDNGLIGTEELDIFAPTLAKLKKAGVSVEGPFSSDGFFQAAQYQKYSVVVAAYHDQGLISFKAIHQHEGSVHMTMGLPFLRLSVDHGTAKDIAGSSRVDFSSMEHALRKALQFKVTKPIYKD